MELSDLLGPWTEPPALLVSGESGSGKTVTYLKAFVNFAVVLQLPGAARGWNKVLGLPPDKIRIKTVTHIGMARRLIGSMVEHNEAIKKGTKAGRPILAVIPDDLSLLASATFRRLRAKIGRKDNFWFHEQLKSEIGAFVHDCKTAGMFVAANAHLSPPGTGDDGRPYKGGPGMPVKSLVGVVPYTFDTSTRVGIEDLDRKPWPSVLLTDLPTGSYHCKDRHNTFREVSPLNIRELLLQAEYNLPRFPGLEWQDKVSEDIAGMLAAADDPSTRFTELWSKKMEKLRDAQTDRNAVLHWRWAMEDGRDRFEIRRAGEASLYAL